MLELVDLCRTGLKPASFAVPAGSCVAVRGASGAGKTLLLRAIADLDPSEGDVRFEGTSRSAIPAPAWRRQIVYVPAVSGWWSDMVGAHFADAARAAELLPRLRLPPDAMQWTVARCSTGELARLALARAVAIRPKVLLLDEPTAGLDADSVASVETLIGECVAEGTAVLWVTHDAAQAQRVAARTLTMEAGALRDGLTA
jgi:phosphate-transporting ATPase